MRILPGMSMSSTLSAARAPAGLGGIRLLGADERALRASLWHFSEQLRELGLSTLVDIEVLADGGLCALQIRLLPVLAEHWVPGHDTSRLCTTLGLDIRHRDDLCREIILSLLACPQTLEFPSLAEWQSALKARLNIVEAARDTVIGAGPETAWPPAEDWLDLGQGACALRPGRSLISALQRSLHPAHGDRDGGKVLSSLRASEQVLLLGMAEEARRQNPALYLRQIRQAERGLPHGQAFSRIWLQRLGAPARPLPARFGVPGDRLWFRNPHPASARVPGHAGLWSVYLGNGLYSDFRPRGQPQSLTERCLEIHHWRDAVWSDHQGQSHVHEGEVLRLVRHTWDDPVSAQRVMEAMLSLQTATDRPEHGGCIDPAREFPRWLCPGSSDILNTDD